MNDIIGMHTGPPLVVHGEGECAGRHCCIHRPSDHPLSTRPLNWRGSSVGMERICEHGVGHPDPDDLTYRRSVGLSAHGIHGCDLCCAGPPDLTQERPMTAERKTLDGMVIVPRKVSTKKTRRPVYGWTQHRTDCVYASRIKYGQQAPITPYPNTVNCKTCLPEGDHRYEYAELPDGTWIGTCSACDDLKVTSASKAGARHKLSRSHQAQRIVESEESP